jgi:hypothetical protein
MINLLMFEINFKNISDQLFSLPVISVGAKGRPTMSSSNRSPDTSQFHKFG